MAMEQGEKRAIHPFFRKDFGVSPNPVAPVANNTPSHDPSQNAAPIVGHDTVNGQSTEERDYQHPRHDPRPSYILTLPVALLDPDPNSSRRKRRRTDQQEASGAANGIPSDEISSGEENFAPVGPIEIRDDIVSTPAVVTHARTPSNAGPVPASPLVTEEPTPATPGTANDETAGPDASERRYPERQRTLRLNPNGKLLSSPVGKQSEKTDEKKKDNRGSKKGSRKSKGDDKKLMVIKYTNDEITRERLGKIIDDIVNGRTRFGPQPLASKPNLASGPRFVPIAPAPVPTSTPIPRVVASQPPKPTHPFFMKKSAQKADNLIPAQSHPQDSATTDAPAGDAHKSPSMTRENSGVNSSGNTRPALSSFKQRSKFPEPIHPLWPPQDFVHVRGTETPSNSQGKDPSCSLGADQKKAKDAVIRIHDNENVLLSGMYGQSIKKIIPRALRIPGRHIASGQTLRKAMARQLSDYFWSQDPTKMVQNKDMHPAVSRLDSSLATSMTAFDRGQCDTSPWAQKYAPNCAGEVLQTGREAHMLRDWLRFLVVSAVDTGRSSKDGENAKQKAEDKKRAKKRKKSEKLDGFIVSSEDEASKMGELSDSEEDELAGGVTVSSKRTVVRSGDLAARSKSGTGRMTNAILLSGPSGCGKTASIYAVAKELDFEVFEINPGNRRNGRDILERVGDMTRNHLVHKLNVGEGASNQPSRDASPQAVEPEEGKQNKLMSFFKPQPTNINAKETKSTRKEAEDTEAKSARPQKQSLILLEEADILFEEDRQFWSGVMSLIQQSRRPIIITCNDENLIPWQDISFHAILRYQPPPHELAVDYLLLLAGNEGHMLQRPAVSDLYITAGSDLRKAIMDLNFWCQMAIGSKKSGLDWMVDRWPPGRDLDQNGDPLRVLSLNTYQQYMGWFNRDMLLDDTLESEVESQQESLHWWQLSIQDSETMAFSSSRSVPGSLAASKHEQLEKLRYEAEYADMRSVLDMFCTGCPVDPKLDAVDHSAPPMPERHRANYIEGHPLLQADLKPEYSSLSVAIGSTSETLIGKTFRPRREMDVEFSKAAQVLANTSNVRAIRASDKQLSTAFEPMIRGDEMSSSASGRPTQSFNNGPGPLWEDLAPYIRAIVAFDLRLEQYRLKLSGLLSPSAGSKRKMRKTRASRAALEGGDKANTRKERWFPPDTNPARILATGNKEWQDLLVQSGHFATGLAPEADREPSREPDRESSEAASESSSDELAEKES